jgi:hypothetical protein
MSAVSIKAEIGAVNFCPFAVPGNRNPRCRTYPGGPEAHHYTIRETCHFDNTQQKPALATVSQEPCVRDTITGFELTPMSPLPAFSGSTSLPSTVLRDSERNRTVTTLSQLKGGIFDLIREGD